MDLSVQMDTPFTSYTDIQCVYPISGSYGVAPRVLYYFLVFAVATCQRYPRLVAGASAYCISYAGATAVHAVVLAAISGSSTSSLADGHALPDATTSVWVAGRVLDHDVDATFVVVGVGYLSSLIFAVSTASFQDMAPKPVIVLWALLMLVGMAACMVNFYSINESETGPFLQARFCPPGANDTLPLSGIPMPHLGDTWNQTIWSFFNTPGQAATRCFYPCLASSEILRDQPEIQIIPFSSLQIAGPGFTIYSVLAAVTWGALPLTALAGCLLVVGQWKGWFEAAESPPFAGYASLWENLRPSDGGGPRQTGFKSLTMVTVLQVYALIITPLLIVVLIVFMEWSLAVYPPSETAWHVGQWSPLVGIGFVAIAMLVSGERSSIQLHALLWLMRIAHIRHIGARPLRRMYFRRNRESRNELA